MQIIKAEVLFMHKPMKIQEIDIGKHTDCYMSGMGEDQ